MRRISFKRKYFARFSLEKHSEIVTTAQMKEIQEKFYLTNSELAYLFDCRPRTFKKIIAGVIPMPFVHQLVLYYLMQDPAMIYKLIKEKKKFERAKQKEAELLQQQGAA